MKVAIMTFHNVVNYGGVLQCYALQQKLKEWEYDVEVIDYENTSFKKFYSPLYVTKPYLRKLLYMIYAFPQKYIRRKRFSEFTHNYIRLSTDTYNVNNICNVDGKYDVYISGSDQVWNLELTENDKNYFLYFVKNGKKISYAASIGIKNIPEEMKSSYVELISNFDEISVREESAAQIVKQLIDREANVHIDPVLLLNKEEWSEICDDNLINENEQYIVVYKINKSKVYEAARELSRKTGLKVKVIQPDKTCPRGFEKMKYVSPIEFVTLFKNAKYVITDSFHGTVFSIIFQKQFAYYLDQSTNNRNSRIQNLLELLSLKNRSMVDYKDINKIDDIIDYGKVCEVLDVKREISKKYLMSSIS